MTEFIIGMIEMEESDINKISLFESDGKIINYRHTLDSTECYIDDNSVTGFKDFSSASKFITQVVDTHNDIVANNLYKDESILLTYPDIILNGFKTNDDGTRVPCNSYYRIIRKEGNIAYIDRFKSINEINKLNYEAKILKYSQPSFLYILDKVNDETILESLIYAIKHGVDISKIHNIESFDIYQIHSLISAINRGIDIEPICNPRFKYDLMNLFINELDKDNDISEFVNLPEYVSSECIKCVFILKMLNCKYDDLIIGGRWTYKDNDIFNERILDEFKRRYLKNTGKNLMSNISTWTFKQMKNHIIDAMMRNDDSYLYIITSYACRESYAEEIKEYFEKFQNNRFMSILRQYSIETPNSNIIYNLDDIIKYKIDPKKTGLDLIINYKDFNRRFNDIIKIIKKFEKV